MALARGLLATAVLFGVTVTAAIAQPLTPAERDTIDAGVRAVLHSTGAPPQEPS